MRKSNRSKRRADRYDLRENLLTVLYALEKSPCLLTRQQVIELLEDTTAFTYFDTASSIASLQERGMVYPLRRDTGEYVKVLGPGRQALALFVNNIRAHLKDAIDAYLQANAERLIKNEQLQCFILEQNGEQKNILFVYENHRSLMELVLPAPDISAARQVAARWPERAAAVYQAVYGILYADASGSQTTSETTPPGPKGCKE